MNSADFSILSERDKGRIEYLVQEYVYHNYRKIKGESFEVSFVAYLGGSCEKINIDMLDAWIEYAKTTETYKNFYRQKN